MLSNFTHILKNKKLTSQALNATSIRLNATANVAGDMRAAGFSDEEIAKLQLNDISPEEKERREKQILREIISDKPRADACDPILGLKDTPFINRLKDHLQDINVLIGGYTIRDIENAILLQNIVKREETEKKRILADEYSRELLKNSEDADAIKQVPATPKVEEQSLEVSPETLDLMTQAFLDKKNALIKILTVKNAGENEKINTAIEFAKKEFQLHKKDVSSPVVRAGIATIRILFLTEYCKKNPKDKVKYKQLNQMVQNRQKLLKNLKISDPEKYFFAITKIGLTDEAVHNEFHLSAQYMQIFKFFGPETQTYKQTRSEKRLAFKHRLMFARYPEYVKELQKEYNVEDLDFIPKSYTAK